MRRFSFVFAGLFLLAALSPLSAFAQSGSAACPVSAQLAKVVSGTTYTVALGDQCSTLVFTNTGAVAVTLPNAATTFPVGFTVAMKATGGTVTVTPTTSTINGASTAVLSAGTGFSVATDGTNYYTQGGGAGQTMCTGSGATPQTCNGAAGVVTTASMTTAASTAAAAYVIDNAAVSATSEVACTVNAYSGTIHTNGVPVISQCVPGSGTITVTIQNVDTTNALSGTVGIGFRVAN